jgi:hypothetical protein
VIATVSLPGGKNFEAIRVRNADEARAWRAAWLEKHGESQETLEAVRQGLLLTEKEAVALRYRSGERVFYVVNRGVAIDSWDAYEYLAVVDGRGAAGPVSRAEAVESVTRWLADASSVDRGHGHAVGVRGFVKRRHFGAKDWLPWHTWSVREDGSVIRD